MLLGSMWSEGSYRAGSVSGVVWGVDYLNGDRGGGVVA